MKIKSRLFILFAILIMAIIPVINYKSNYISKKELHDWLNKTTLYNFDSILPYVSQVLYSFGISIAPNYVVIGKNDWLFLGDTHEQSITRQRHGFALPNATLAQQIGGLSKSRAEWLKTKGVAEYVLIVSPDKSTIYNDQLPNWAKPTEHTFTDYVITQSKNNYLDTRSIFKAAKKAYQEPLYFKTDTHWNNLGGWIAYLALAQRLSQSRPELYWFSDKDIVKSIIPRDAGDLANFLRMEKILKDTQIDIKIDNISAQVGEHFLLENINLAKNANSSERVTQKIEPLITIKSKTALNNKKVLWLHDSFGFAMEPFLYGTFNEVLQGPYSAMNQVRFEKIIELYKPDYVFITVVERKLAADFFLQ
jgi:alginate O-acetyltransferase complex protein AlgJ